MDEFQSPRAAAVPPTASPADVTRDASPAELAAGIRALARTSVLVVGDAMLDRYIYGTVERISPEAPVPVLSVEREVAVPGGAGNVVRNLGALGVAVAFVSVVGDDQAGSDLTGLIGSQPGVEPWLLVQGSRTTTRKTRFMAQGQQLLRTDREDTAPIHHKLAERLLRIVRDAMAATSVTILSDYGKGVLALDMPAQIIAAARTTGRRVVVDMRGTDFARYAGADVILPNQHDLALFAGTTLGSDSSIAAAAATLRALHGFGAVLVNRAEEGMTLVDALGVTHLHTEQADLCDISGAGDTTVAALAAGLAAGLDIRLAARIATLAAGIVRGRSGIAVAREGDLLAAIAPQGSALRKIVNIEVAAARVENWRRDGLQTVVTMGRYATLSEAEITTLRDSRTPSDRLVIGLERDADAKADEHDAVRAARLAALDMVDLVVIIDRTNPAELLHALRPDLLFGSANQPGAELMPTWGGRVASF